MTMLQNLEWFAGLIRPSLRHQTRVLSQTFGKVAETAIAEHSYAASAENC